MAGQFLEASGVLPLLIWKGFEKGQREELWDNYNHKDTHPQSTSYVPGLVLILTANHCCSHLTDKETEAQKGEGSCLRPLSFTRGAMCSALHCSAQQDPHLPLEVPWWCGGGGGHLQSSMEGLNSDKVPGTMVQGPPKIKQHWDLINRWVLVWATLGVCVPPTSLDIGRDRVPS